MDHPLRNCIIIRTNFMRSLKQKIVVAALCLYALVVIAYSAFLLASRANILSLQFAVFHTQVTLVGYDSIVKSETRHDADDVSVMSCDWLRMTDSNWAGFLSLAAHGYAGIVSRPNVRAIHSTGFAGAASCKAL